MKRWTAEDIAPQPGRSFLVTGPGGLGFETALALARKGARVILAGRSEAKGIAARDQIRAQIDDAQVEFELLDLASLASIQAFADRITRIGSLDVLVNNAGVMAPPERRTTADGFEVQIGTNHLGHFALTGRLLPLLRKGRKPRVVSVSSLAHNGGRINLGDLQAERRYRPWARYNQSKLANLLFARELQRRSDAAGWGLKSLAAHPGVSATELIANGPGRKGFANRAMLAMAPLFFQSASQGALPTLYAATVEDASGYYGPNGLFEMRGWPARARLAPQAQDDVTAKALWELSEQLTGVRYPISA